MLAGLVLAFNPSRAWADRSRAHVRRRHELVRQQQLRAHGATLTTEVSSEFAFVRSLPTTGMTDRFR